MTMYNPKIDYINNRIFAGSAFPRIVGDACVTSDLEKGTVLASRGVASAAVKAKKSVTFTGTPVASKTIKFIYGETTVTYSLSSATLATEVTGLASAINSNATVSAVLTASASGGKLSVEFDAAGYAGNDFGFEIEVGDGAGVSAGDIAVEVIGQDAGQELFDVVDSDSATSALQKPVAVLLSDTKAGNIGPAAFTGQVDAAMLKFAAGDSVGTFVVELRKIGIFPETCV